MPGHRHRSGALKQSNKKNKRSKASKRSLSRAAGGKLAGQKSTLQRQLQQSKTDRRNRQAQIRQNKREELLRQRRGIDSQQQRPPRVVGIINLGVPSDIEERIRRFLIHPQQQDDNNNNHQLVNPHEPEPNATVTVKYDVHKKDGVLTLLTCDTAFAPNYQTTTTTTSQDGLLDEAATTAATTTEPQNGTAVLAALDLARVADVLLFVVDGNGPETTGHGIGNNNDPILDMQISDDHASTTTTAGRTHHTTGSGSNKWDHLISERGDAILTALKAQGVPTAVTVLAQTERDPLDDAANDQDHMTMQSVKSLRRGSIKRRLDVKKYLSRFATTEFGNGNDKVVEVDLSGQQQDDNANNGNKNMDSMENDEDVGADADAANNTTTGLLTSSTSSALRSSPATLIRTLCTMSCSPSKWVANSPRTWLLSDSYQYNPNTNELSIQGYLRGMAPLDINALVHIPCIGTFAPKSITRLKSPLLRQMHQKRRKKNLLDLDMDNNDQALMADAEQQESLNMFATPDALAGEQNLIGFDDNGNFDEDDQTNAGGGGNGGNDDEPMARPAGWSDYQSAWLDAMGDDAFDNDNDDDMDRGELADALNQKKSDTASVGGDMIDLEDANNVTQAERESLLEQRRKEQNEHEEFPDEVQVGEDDEASKRFARYRSLKSFRKSYWDPKENLPDSFASVYHFSSFKTTQRLVMSDMREAMRVANDVQGRFFGKTPAKPSEDATMAEESEDEYDPLEGCVPTGSYVSLTLGNVSKESLQSLSNKALITAVSLLEHENKVSVLHMGLSQSNKMAPSDNVPIKSKDVLTFRCGWRTWQARPIFSQNNLNCDKHKFERFLPAGGAFFAASIFGPVTYTPCPVLVWKNIEGQPELVASGTMMNADADRIVVKRVILTGYPVRVHKRHATVKYMFYNPEDVKWFKPAELYSKHGLRGNILESVGEHGTMKCLFNAPIKQHDTVCLPLYKRVFPKYVPSDEQDTLIIT
mmetsp:Transcript_10551/g.23365  ORF Transcript_10551/g.23365 Transcript_10551/m.23365 type:complete len:985 (-) Transcript_10551:25-2979(-)